MTYNDILRLYPALLELSRLRLPVRKAWILWQALTDVRARFEFYCAEEMKIAVKYAICSEGKPIMTKSGQITFSSDDRRKGYETEIAALKAGDAGNIEPPIEIKASELEGQTLSAETIGRLSPEIKIIFDGETDK